jgi:ABC-type transport system substrate-binding protein
VVEKVQQIKKTMRGKQEFDMLLEDLAALLTVEHNGYLIEKSAPMSLPNTTDDKVDEMFAAYRKEMDTAKREQIGYDLQRYVADNMYWGSLTGSPIPIALQNRVQDFVYRDHFKVQFERVWIQQ